MIDLKEDKDFLIAQRERGRRGTFGPIDTALAAKEVRKEEERLNERKMKYDDELKATISKVFLNSSSDADSQRDSEDSDQEIIFNRTNIRCRI